MAAPHSAQLNSEPADPEGRREHNLPAKSFVDALQQDPPVNGMNGNKVVNGTNGTDPVNGSEKNEDGKHTASVLRIVDTGAPETKGKEETRPEYDRQESNHEYSGAVCFLYASLMTDYLLPAGSR
jgi:2-acylglycerol O-acyltransferase 2